MHSAAQDFKHFIEFLAAVTQLESHVDQTENIFIRQCGFVARVNHNIIIDLFVIEVYIRP